MANNICLICKKRPKRKDHQFCSTACTNRAARMAPALIKVPKGHVMYNNVKSSFVKTWKENTPKPTITGIFLLPWTVKSRNAFEKYRDNVAKKRKLKTKEVKRFRSEKRACHLGDSKKNMKFCKRKSCNMCKAIKSSFHDTLKFKQGLAKKKSKVGVRFGGGIYISPTSNRAFNYAKNVSGNRSHKLALMSVRCVLGKVQKLSKEEHGRLKPNKGYDSVEGKAANGQTELVVYNADAVRPAYLIIVK
ncbi:hypothetical protein BC629DRAFT_1591221 [Irpex lacteus]|nr:hypothetical protein BC629DRAFT_1591221 [Irpex lacteus]